MSRIFYSDSCVLTYAYSSQRNWFYLWMLHRTKWPVPKAPYLIEQTAIAPDITGSGVLSKVYGFWGCPLYGHFATLGYIVIIISQVPGHSKVCNL